MPFFHGIVLLVAGWVRVLTGVELLPGTDVLKELHGGAYVPAFMENFFSGRYRVETRRINVTEVDGVNSAPPITKAEYTAEVIRWSTASDQYTVRIKGSTGWLSSFKEIGLDIRNSKKMSKRLVELVRLTSAWFYDPDGKLKVEVIDHSYPECYVDGISAISRSLAIKCVLSNTQATRRWRIQQIWKIRTGETACVVFRMLDPMGLIKGNALVLPKRMMNGYDVRTFTPNIKGEICTSGWQWVTIEPTYGAIPVKSDDLTHSIYRGVDGLYDDDTMLSSMKYMLDQFFIDLKDGRRSEWLTKLAESSNNILHDEDAEKRYVAERGLIGRIQLAIAQLKSVGIPLNASQSLMFLTANGLSKQLLDENLFDKNKRIGRVWEDKDRHWFPVPWAYAAHVYTVEVLNLFGFNLRSDRHGFYHKATHGFVVPGEFFQRNLANHGGPDLDDTVKVHIRTIIRPDGNIRKAAFILRNPNDFGEWSMIPIHNDGPVFHAYGEIPTVSMEQLVSKVPQFTKLRDRLTIGELPCIVNKANLSDEFSLADEARVREASTAFPAGVGATVIPKMIWYATQRREIRTLVAPNEDIIDALQQGQAGPEDVRLIQEWIDQVFGALGRKGNYTMDAFWYKTRLPKSVIKDQGWESQDILKSSWVSLHRERESMVRESLDEMAKWLNANIVMPDVLANIRFTKDELKLAAEEHSKIEGRRLASDNWVPEFAGMLQKSDDEKGEAYTDRKILRLAYWSIMTKKQYHGRNYDQWLYTFTAVDEPHPYEWFIRALTRVQDGTHS
jgi:hypothetical protein